LTLRQLIDDATTGIGAVAAYLDGMSPAERVGVTRGLDRATQRRLFLKAGDAPPVTLDDFVPRSVPPETPVAHDGRNTLHLPGKLRHFQKRFARPATASTQGARLFGYNASPFEYTIGPGFFVAVPTAGRPEWEARGAVVVDYFQVPDGPVPAAWPPVVPNTKGLQRFVYHRTRDFMRRVSSHVTIGAAYREEKAMDHYFVLCREA
jgi:hypothetical protein